MSKRMRLFIVLISDRAEKTTLELPGNGSTAVPRLTQHCPLLCPAEGSLQEVWTMSLP